LVGLHDLRHGRHAARLILGGVVAQKGGIGAPWWFAFVGSAVFVVLIWGQLAYIAHADESPPASEPIRDRESVKENV
jgi:hypothetical protein